MKTPLSILQSFARQRERAYRMNNCMNESRLKAIMRIKQLADYWKSLPEGKQQNIVRQLKAEVLLLLPHPESRFQTQREKILELINN